MELVTNKTFTDDNGSVYLFQLLNCNLENHIVDFKHSTSELDIKDLVVNPSPKEGYKVLGASNGGAFLSSNGTPLGSCQVYNQELSDYQFYDDNTYGVGIKDGRLEIIYSRIQ